MKKIIVFLFVLMTTIVHADTITILNNGKAGGSFNARSTMYNDALTLKGYKVKWENIGKISQAVKVFETATEPTMMVYSTNQSNKRGLFNNKDNFVLLEYEQPMHICTRNESIGKSGTITVAHGKGYDPSVLQTLLGKNIVLVPYKNSGAILKGMLGGDVDVMVNNQGKSLKYAASGKGTCTVSERLPMMHATVIAKNVDLAKLRLALKDIVLNDPLFVQYHSTRQLEVINLPREMELEIVQGSEKAWK
tara:strand:- start:180 stop:926 length:747 start_codon:yes stop_codon:yes gene_type:complete